VAFGLGRALPVMWLAPRLATVAGARSLERMAAEPRLWLGLRRLDAIGLGLCAVLLSAAAAGAAVLPRASDPSASGAALAWQPLHGAGLLRQSSGEVSVLSGSLPALGPATIAWLSGEQVVVARLPSLAATVTIPATGVTALAASDSWIAYRAATPAGGESLIAVSLTAPQQRRFVRGVVMAGEIGRPALDGSTVVYAVDTARRARIEAVNLDTGARAILRSRRAGSALLNPALLNGTLMYERIDRCAQELRIGAPNTRRRDRVLFRLPSTVRRDPGYQVGYRHGYNRASLCRRRRPRRGSAIRLGATALSASFAYVTEIAAPSEEARIIALRR
jgi:hypothetical protein